jgi:hypothetical protein
LLADVLNVPFATKIVLFVLVVKALPNDHSPPTPLNVMFVAVNVTPLVVNVFPVVVALNKTSAPITPVHVRLLAGNVNEPKISN